MRKGLTVTEANRLFRDATRRKRGPSKTPEERQRIAALKAANRHERMVRAENRRLDKLNRRLAREERLLARNDARVARLSVPYIRNYRGKKGNLIRYSCTRPVCTLAPN